VNFQNDLPKEYPVSDNAPTPSHSCAHCNGEGTCINGKNNASCKVCVKKTNSCLRFHICSTKQASSSKTEKEPVFSDDNEEFGLVCSVCSGRGRIEQKGGRLSRYTLTGLTAAIFVFSGILIFKFAGEEQFPEILTFVSTLMGSVTGYYFGQKRKM